MKKITTCLIMLAMSAGLSANVLADNTYSNSINSSNPAGSLNSSTNATTSGNPAGSLNSSTNSSNNLATPAGSLNGSINSSTSADRNAPSDSRSGSGMTSGSSGTAGAEVGDTALAMKVKSALQAETAIKSSGIAVQTTHKGEVQLSGSVASSTEAKRAVQIAYNVEGVKSVVNKINVKQ